MKHEHQVTALNRRQFFRTSLLGSAALAAAASLPDSACAGPTKTPREPYGSLKVGLASYTLHSFDLDRAIDMSKLVALKYICLKDVHLPLKSTLEDCQVARQKLAAAGIQLVGGGVLYMKTETEVQNTFAYAKRAGLPTMVCSPQPELLDLVEKLAKEADMVIAIHNHGPTDQTYPSPRDVFRLVKDRDARMGICMDVGHTVRIGEDPVEVIRDCASRLYDFHIKDVTAATPQGKPTELGKGVIDLVAVLKALLAMKYSHFVNLEYEANASDPLPGMLECYGYLRGILAVL